jgi:cytochrome c biogenesis protein CcmG, thiol:disulfide interchange protein DsbE
MAPDQGGYAFGVAGFGVELLTYSAAGGGPFARPVYQLLGLVFAACGSDDDRGSVAPPDPFIDGGREAFEAFIDRQRGSPVVVNKWASWCGPCRFEFPFFESQARKRRGEVVFVGVNSDDNRADARDFLDEHPVPYKHFDDPKQDIAASFNGVQGFPVTAFYRADGEREFVHFGGYASEEQLAEDIDRYAR